MNKSYRQSTMSPDEIEQMERTKARKREIARLRIEEMVDDEEDDLAEEIKHFVKNASKKWK